MTTQSHELKSQPFKVRQGFTLVELIATLTLAAVLVAMMLPMIGSSLQGSRHGLLSLPETNSLRSEMDAIWHLYRSTEPSDLPALSAALSSAAAANPPPPYTLIHNHWVDFDAQGNEFVPPEGTENVLKVTLGNSEGERLTTYFFPLQ